MIVMRIYVLLTAGKKFLSSFMKILLLFALSLSVTTGFCQHSPIPQLLKRDTVFFEDFNVDNDTNWVDEDDKNIVIKGGFFYYHSKEKDITAQPFHVNLDTNRNFEFQFRAKAPDKKSDRGVFFWGRDVDTNSYKSNYWYFYKDGVSNIYNIADPAGTGHYTSSRFHARVDEDGFNVYALRKWKHQYYMYVNNHLVKVIEKELPCYGQMLGLGAGSLKRRKALEVFDYISVSYIE
jgi:hypothetical protein